MNVLFVETLGDGGIAHYTYNLVNALRKKSINVTLLTSFHHELNFDKIETLNIFFRLAFSIIHYIPVMNRETTIPTLMRRIFKVTEFPINMLQAVKYAKLKRPDIIHFQTITLIDLLMVMLFKFYGFKVVYTIHNVCPGHKKLNRISQKAYRFLYRYCDFFIIHSEISKKEAIELYAINNNKIRVIPHGNYNFFVPKVSTPKQKAKQRLGIDSNCKTILFFGAIRKNKGLRDLIAAMPSINKSINNVKLLIVGEPLQDYNSYRKQIENLSIKNLVYETLEYVPNNKISNFFYAADLVAMPYHEISQSGVLYMAYAFKKPVVATCVGGFNEVVEDGKNGYLVPPGKPKILAEKIIRILSDDVNINKMGDYSLLISKKFSWDSIALQTIQVYLKMKPKLRSI